MLYLFLEEAGLIPVLAENNAPAFVKVIRHDVPDLIIGDSLLIDNMSGLTVSANQIAAYTR